MTHGPKTPNRNLKKKSILNYTTPRVIRGLNSSLAQSAAHLWLVKFFPERTNYTFSKTFWILSKTGFLSHNFGHRYAIASKSIKGSKDADFGLVFKKMGQWVAAQGQVNSAKLRKHSLIVTSPPENTKSKAKKIFFRSQIEYLLNPQRVWKTL